MQHHHIDGSTESLQTAHSPPSSPPPDILEPELTTQRLSSQTTLTGSDRRRSIRHSTPSVPPRLIREDGFVTSEHNPTDSSPSTPIPSSSRPRPRRPSLSDFDYADMCLRYHYWTPHGYLPRTYISEELCMAMLIPASSLFFLLLWYPEPATAIPISLTALAITLWANYEYFIGRPCF
ncbi:hypothetical protein VE01_02113 [Pseudogymnoascus verrucosus]|uniref:Uncharacterized protein n=1 Tax=Pseudogymnoascus verrucosus TaxID=342668 RepID=A0A1B8GVK5_9PEZI|nr:uncharacterized protein VE01_02113 [Pseudogymnoascus verrucosus]OBT99830.1 hypothetical protein VE01_02113 [Pseudogymnoascus verrucosus]